MWDTILERLAGGEGVNSMVEGVFLPRNIDKAQDLYCSNVPQSFDSVEWLRYIKR